MVREEPENVAWNNQFEDLLETWMHKAYGYRWLHDTCSKYYRKKNRMISIPTLLLSTVMSAVSFSSSGSESDESQLMAYFQSGLSVTATILIAMQNFLKFQSEYEKHALLSQSFSTYYREIQSTLVMPREYRDNPIEIINNKRLEYDRLLNNQVHIPNSILNDYIEKFKGKMVLIDLANGFHFRDEKNAQTEVSASNTDFSEWPNAQPNDYNDYNNQTEIP
jgi:hypothetical protein